MSRRILSTILLASVAVAAGATAQPGSAIAASAQEINREATAALETLFEREPATRDLAKKAKAVLVFPSVIKAGFMIGGQYGEGALRQNGKTVGYYNTVAASYGLQAGGQAFGYAMFFMNDEALRYLNNSKGWEVGVGPTIVVVEAGKAKTFTTTTAKDDVYAFIFDQKGLMGGLGIQGSKITKIKR
jgi:lipid-binding SYLF domain-containing protein